MLKKSIACIVGLIFFGIGISVFSGGNFIPFEIIGRSEQGYFLFLGLAFILYLHLINYVDNKKLINKNNILITDINEEKFRSEKLINDYQNGINILNNDIEEKTKEVDKLKEQSSSPDRILERTAKLDTITEKVSEALTNNMIILEASNQSIDRLSQVPATVEQKLNKLTSGITALLDTVDAQPEKVLVVLTNSVNTTNTDLIEVAVNLRRLEDTMEEGELDGWEDALVEILVEMKETFGLNNEKFLGIAWAFGKVLAEVGGSGSEHGDELYEAVEKALPSVSSL